MKLTKLTVFILLLVQVCGKKYTIKHKKSFRYVIKPLVIHYCENDQNTIHHKISVLKGRKICSPSF